jgi:hypothetical protein
MGIFFPVKIPYSRIFKKARCGIVDRGKTLCNQRLDENPDTIFGSFRYIFSMRAHFLKESIYSMPAVEELPDEQAGRVQAETVTRVRVIQNRPIVKLFTEYGQGVGKWFFATSDAHTSTHIIG